MNEVDISHSSRSILVLMALLACAGALVAWSSGAHAQDDGRFPLIVGGETVKAGELPSLALVLYLIPNGKHEATGCTGTVIAPRLVLTAAHCVRPLHVRVSVENFRVVVGDVNWKGPDRKVLDVVRVMNYPRNYRGTGDAALLELATATKAPPMPLAGRRFWSSGSRAEFAGWGVLHPGQRTPTYLLHRAPTAVLGFRECRKQGGRRGQICAEEAPPPETSACYGDSGGPLLMHRPGDRRLVEVGIVHGGDSCDPQSPTLLTSTVPIFNWVRAQMATAAGARLRSRHRSP